LIKGTSEWCNEIYNRLLPLLEKLAAVIKYALRSRQSNERLAAAHANLMFNVWWQ